MQPWDRGLVVYLFFAGSKGISPRGSMFISRFVFFQRFDYYGALQYKLLICKQHVFIENIPFMTSNFMDFHIFVTEAKVGEQ